MVIDYKEVVKNLKQTEPDITFVAIIEGEDALVYSTEDWDKNFDVRHLLSVWKTFPKSITISEKKYSVLQCAPERLVAISYKGGGSIIGAKDDEHKVIAHLNPDGYGMIGYNLTKNSEDILIYHNGGKYTNDVSLPSGAWMLISDQDEAGLESLGTFAVRYPIEKAETLVFVRGNTEDIISSPFLSPEITNIVFPEAVVSIFKIVFFSNRGRISKLKLMIGPNILFIFVRITEDRKVSLSVISSAFAF